MNQQFITDYDVRQWVSFRTDMHETGFFDLLFPEEPLLFLLDADELGLLT